jgi:hypothetical protein
MLENYRRFEAADPFGQTWQVDFLWLQTAISIRHSDSVDVKFALASGAEKVEKVVALMNPLLLELSQRAGRPITDPWCARLAALHVKRMIETWEDMEKPLVTPTLEELERCQSLLSQSTAA